jgi:SAM-dependent methyltransferase
MNSKPNAFARSGLAALSDLDSPEWRQIFELLEGEQALFLEHESEFRSPEYIWPRDPLHNWSRIWEYPYVMHHLQSFGYDWKRTTPAKVVDLGSGVTFFPFAVAKKGFEVICTDVDPICEKDLKRAIPRVEHGTGRVSFRLSNGSSLPFEDCEADAVYCISVLEHVPNLDCTVREIARILKPEGLLLLTVDLDLRGDFDLGVKQQQRLVCSLGEYFEFRCPEVTLHPADVLNSVNGPFGYKPPVGWRRARFLAKERIMKRILGRKPKPLVPFFLAVQGFAMVRRQVIRSEAW